LKRKGLLHVKNKHTWRAGYGVRDITPKIGSVMVGYWDDFRSTAVHDPLETAVLCVEDGKGTRALVITFDLCLLRYRPIEKIASAVQKATGIPRRLQMFNCSHTHSGPAFDSPRDFADGAPWVLAPDGTPYFEYLIGQTVAAARDAVAALHPVQASVSRVQVGSNINRDIITPDLKYHYLSDHKHLAPLAGGVVDNYLGILSLRDAQSHKLDYLVVNYSCHPVNVGVTTTAISADYVGVFRQVIRESGCTQPVFIQGGTGNTHPRLPESGYSAARRHGEYLAETALNHSYDSAQSSADWVTGESYAGRYGLRSLGIRGRMVDYSFKLSPQALPAYRRMCKDPYGKGVTGRRKDGLYMKTALQVLQIGDIALCGLPGELMSELALQIKWNSPCRHTWMSGLSTDWISYINHRFAFVHKGYETTATVLDPLGGYRMADRFIRELHALQGRPQA
jgi:neutral ceramidase